MRKYRSLLLFIQDDSNATLSQRKSKHNARKNFFQFAFKSLEVILIISQIAECIFEIFKK